MSLSNDSGQISDDSFIEWQGEIFNNRYIALQKLGYGACSSVWLFYDNQLEKCVAIKVFNINDYSFGTYEVDILKKISNLKSQYCIKFMESFDKDTDNGCHLCIVLELMKSSLYSYRKENNINLTEIKLIAKQTLEFLISLNNAGLVHTDIKPENMLLDGHIPIVESIYNFIKEPTFKTSLLQIKKNLLKSNKKLDMKKVGIIAMKNMLINQFYKHSNDNDNKTNSESSDSSDNSDDKPSGNYFFSHNFIENSDNENSNSDNNSDKSVEEIQYDILSNNTNIQNIQNIKVTDFNTCQYINKPDYEIQTRYYRAPEVLLECNFSEKIDIWSLGCTLYELLTREILLNPDDIKDFSEDRYHVYLIHQKIGIFDDELWNMTKKKYIYLDSNNLLRGFNDIKIEPFWDSLIKKYGESEQLMLFIDFLLNCLEINPIKRKSAKDLISHSFLQ
jgi:serine/threonine-protein kinase SRPK3